MIRVSEVLVRLSRTVMPAGRDFSVGFAESPLVGNPILDAAFDNLLGSV